MTLDIDWARAWIARSAGLISRHRGELNTLDREIGDGDHGENLDRGFAAMSGAMESLDADSLPADALKLVAMTLISTVGGAAGPLYGTAFLKGAAAIEGLESLDSASIVAFLAAARDGIVLRGRAEPGDKTMIDAWTPAVDAAARAEVAGADPSAVLAAAATAAEAGAVATEPLLARKGRASYLGERAIGHRDPGAESSALLLRAASDVVGDL